MSVYTFNGEWVITEHGTRRALTGDEKAMVVKLSRELYDRFVMGGWEPDDAYAEIIGIIWESK